MMVTAKPVETKGRIRVNEETKTIILDVVLIVGILALIWGLIRANRLVFRQIQKKHTGLHLRFFERSNAMIILIGGIILAFSVFGGLDSIWKTMLGGTAIVSAVLVFAAQDVLKDILAGLMISLYKPFETGNRVELEDGTFGTIQDINMRHVVIQGMDTQRIIIPNSKINEMRVRNYSYKASTRGIQFDFHIAYGSDVAKAMSVIRDAIIESPYSVPGKQTAHGPDYADIYFMAYEDSSLRLSTTVYYQAAVGPEVVMSDVNLRVDQALAKNGIEIPFAYVNVIHRAE